jgi:hypothetical protein
MCLVIVDVNVAPRVLLDANDRQYSLIHKALFARRRPYATLVYGGKLVDEYNKNYSLRSVIIALDRAGRTKAVPGHSVDTESERVAKSGHASSDDAHILGLARVSGARVLCSEDNPLRADFKNKRLIDKPRGRIYSRSGHSGLLSQHC